MLFYILIYAIFRTSFQGSADASPLQNMTTGYHLITPTFSALNATTFDSQPVCDRNQRSVLDIIWSCASTLFLCTWVSIHPNAPDPDEESWKPLWRRLKLMYFCIVSPELVLNLAIRQFIGARMIFNEHKGPGRIWTMKHAHYLQMGGFHLRSKEYSGVLDPVRFTNYLHEKKIPFPVVPEAEIRDKSKADSLSKLVLFVQTVWFVIQCIGRHVQGLPLTQLEISTLAVISSTSMLSFVWWSKPYDVQYPIYLRIEETVNHGNNLPAIPPYDSAMNDLQEDGRFQTTLEEVHSYLRCASHAVKSYIGHLNAIVDCIRNSISLSIDDKGLLVTIVNMTIVWPFCWPLLSMIQNEDHDIYRGRVSMYYAIDQQDPNEFKDDLKGHTVPIVCGTFFGLIHCLAWNSAFPTAIEKQLWRVSAVAVPASLDLILAFSFLFHLLSVIQGMLLILLGAIAFAYVAARYYLMVESLVALRSLPPAALETINWSNFLPHF